MNFIVQRTFNFKRNTVTYVTIQEILYFCKKIMEEVLTECNLFKGISKSELIHIFNQVNFRRRNYKKGEFIAMMDDRCDNLIILLSGAVSGEMLDFSGKVILIDRIFPPQALASLFLFGENNRFPVNAVATEDSTTIFISRDEVFHLFKLSRAFLKNYLDDMAQRAQFLAQKMQFLSFRTIRGKLAHYLLRMSNRFGDTFILPMSQEKMAELMGVARPSLARVMGELKDEGIIALNRKEIELIDKDALNQLLE